MALVRSEMWGRQSGFSLQTPPTTSTSRLCLVPEIRLSLSNQQGRCLLKMPSPQPGHTCSKIHYGRAQ